MALIDQRVTWRAVEARLATETDPLLRRNLELLRQHMQAEATLDMPRLMATVSPAAHYDFFSQQISLDGQAAVQKFYEDFAASGASKLQHDITRLVVDRDCIFMDGVMRMAYPGAALRARGIEVDDPDAHYLYEAQMGIVWPINPEDGLFIGEDSYVGSDGFAGIADRKIDPAEIAAFDPSTT
jgi:hypothetical protein